MDVNTPASANTPAAPGMTNWTPHDAPTSSTSSQSEQSPPLPTRSHYSFVVEEIGGPLGVGPDVHTTVPEGGTNRAESPRSTSPGGRVIYVGPEEEEALPYNTSQQAVVVLADCPQENKVPIWVPPPGIRQLHVTPSSHDSPLVQRIVHATLHQIRASSSATPGGVFFEEDVADVEEVLSLASQLRHPDCGPEAMDPETSHLMEQLRLVWGHDSKQVIFRGPLFTLP